MYHPADAVLEDTQPCGFALFRHRRAAAAAVGGAERAALCLDKLLAVPPSASAIEVGGEVPCAPSTGARRRRPAGTVAPPSGLARPASPLSPSAMVVGNILIINIAITVTAFIAMINIGIANAVATICWLTCAGLKSFAAIYESM